jgi:alkylhydroperoxidase family enzyme
MARIPTLGEDDPTISPEASEFLKRAERGLGEMFNGLRVLANHPRLANALLDFVRSVRHGGSLPPTLTELAYTTAAVANRCHY